MLNEGNSKKLKKAKKLARKPDVVPLSPIGDLVFIMCKCHFKFPFCFLNPSLFKVTMNMANYGSRRRRRSQQPENVNFEPIIIGLKSDIFD